MEPPRTSNTASTTGTDSDQATCTAAITIGQQIGYTSKTQHSGHDWRRKRGSNVLSAVHAKPPRTIEPGRQPTSDCPQVREKREHRERHHNKVRGSRHAEEKKPKSVERETSPSIPHMLPLTRKPADTAAETAAQTTEGNQTLPKTTKEKTPVGVYTKKDVVLVHMRVLAVLRTTGAARTLVILHHPCRTSTLLLLHIWKKKNGPSYPSETIKDKMIESRLRNCRFKCSTSFCSDSCMSGPQGWKRIV